MKTFLKLSAIIGLSLFSIIFLVTFITPRSLEKSAENFIKEQIETEVKDILEKEKITSTVNFILKIGHKFGVNQDKNEIRKEIESQLPDFIETVVAYKQAKRSEKSKLKKLALSSESFISKFKLGEKKLATRVEEKYDEIKINLKIDIRIFSGINAIMFLILLLLSFPKDRTSKELILPSILLLLSTLISSLIYVFGQNWIYMMMYNDYLGFGYLIYIAIVFLFLLDIAFNKGEITLRILELIGNILQGFAEILSAFSGM